MGGAGSFRSSVPCLYQKTSQTRKRYLHSRKPDEAYELIERMYPDLPKIELFARGQREGWAAWGNEADAA
jgi:N6-adenosine-specific RNA methylase IME4